MGLGKGWLYAFAPLILLAGDFALFPVLLQNRILTDRISVNELVKNHAVVIGRYRLHPLRVSMGAIEDPNYLPSLGGVDSIAISAYSQSAGTMLASGPFTRAVMSLLPHDSSAALGDFLDHTKSYTPGRAQRFPASGTLPTNAFYGIRTILIVRAAPGGGGDARESLRNGLEGLFAEADAADVSKLLLTTLTVDPSHPADSASFDDFFGDLFDALDEKPGRTAIEISLWSGLSTHDIEDAVAALNAHWASHSSEIPGFPSNIYRFQVRLILIGLCLGLLSSALWIPLRARTALIIASSLAVYLLGIFKLVEGLGAGLDTQVQDFIKVALTVVLSAGYPRVIQWSARDLFKDQALGD